MQLFQAMSNTLPCSQLIIQIFGQFKKPVLFFSKKPVLLNINSFTQFYQKQGSNNYFQIN